MNNNNGDLAMMIAVEEGHLEYVREISGLDDVDFGCCNIQFIQLLEERNTDLLLSTH